MIWFINNGAAGCTDVDADCGRLTNPLSTMASFELVNGNADTSTAFFPAAGDNIFVYESGTAYNSTITLEANQKLIGQDATATLAAIAGVTLPADSDGLPAMDSANVTKTRLTSEGLQQTVVLANAGAANTHTIRGLTLGNTATSGAGERVRCVCSTGPANFGTLTIGDSTSPDVAIEGTGRTFDLTNGSFGATSGLISVASTLTSAGRHGLQLVNVGGTVSFGSTSMTNQTVQGIFVHSSSVNINFGNTTVTSGGDQEAVRLEVNTGGSRTFGNLTISNPSDQGITVSGSGSLTVTGTTTITNPGTSGSVADAAGILINTVPTGAGNAQTFANVSITGVEAGGIGVQLLNNGAAVTFADLDISGGGDAFLATNNTGTITTTSGDLSSTSHSALDIDGPVGRTPLAISLTSLSSPGASAATENGVSLVDVSGTFGVTGATTVSNSTGQGLRVENSSATVTLATIAINGTVGSGAFLINNSGAVNLNGGAVGGTSDAGAGGAFAIDIHQSTGNVSVAATVNNTAGPAVRVANRTGGAVALSGNITHTAAGNQGIAVSGNSAGSTTFSGTSKAINSTSNIGVELLNNTGHTVNFTTGGLDVDTTSAAGFTATGGGTVSVTGSNNTILTTTGTALNVANTNIGASGLTFQSINANGGANGIVLNATGTGVGNGGLTVTGTGGATPGTGTGGTIQNTTGDSVSLNSTKAVSLGGMNIAQSGANNAGNDNSNWIDATNVIGLTLNNVNATDSVGHGFLGSSVTNLIIQGGLYRGGAIDNVTNFNPATPGGDANYHGFFITNLLGTSSITGTTFERSNTVQFRVNNNAATNFAGTPDTLTVSDTTWQLHGRPTFAQNPGMAASPFHGDHLSVTSDTGGNFRLNVDSSVGQNVFKSGGTAVQAAAGGTNGKMDANISGIQSGGNTGGGSPTFNDDTNTAMAVIGQTGGGSITYDILNNTSLGTGSVAIKVTHASVPGGTSTGNILNNTITHVAGSGTDAIGFDLQPNGTATTKIADNTITGNYQRGILVQALGGTGVLNATVEDNTLTGSAPDGLQHIVVINGGSGGGHLNTMRLNMFDNTVNPGGTYTAAYRLVSNDAGSTFQLQDLVGAGNVANVTTWITTTKANTGSPIVVDATVPYTASVGAIPVPPPP